MTQLISIFDVDRTLTRLPTYSLFLLFASRRLAPWRLAFLPALLPHLLGYRFKRTTRQRLKEAMHALVLGRRVPRECAERLADDFAAKLAAGGVYPQALTLIEAERAAGRRIVLATGASMLYMAPFAERLGVRDVVATEGSWTDNHLSHRISGDNCYGPTKLAMLRSFMERERILRRESDIRFYSDHASDLPTFEWADEPIAVNPSTRLRSIAEARGWPVLDWRD